MALGLAGVRSAWFLDVARWATVGSLPLEFVKCLSAEELAARLASGRPFSVVLLDAGATGVDRDLIDVARTRDTPVVVVDDGRSRADWPALGAATVLPPDFDRPALLDALTRVASMIGGAVALPGVEADPAPGAGPGGRLVAVTGSGGAGASSVAIALAQGLADDEGTGRVVLADLCLDADQAMLHDARDIVPGLQELVDAHRNGRPDLRDVRDLTYTVVDRRYHLLLGLRRHRDWAVLRRRSLEAAIDGLQRAFDVVVADVDPEVEGEHETGSIEVEERNLVARTTLNRAGVVVVVGRAGLKGLHASVRVVGALREHGVEPERMLAVVVGAPRHPRPRAEHTRTFAALTGADQGWPAVAGPLFLPHRPTLDAVHRDGARLPSSLTNPTAAAVRSVFERVADRAVVDDAPRPIRQGELGSWPEAQAAGR